MNYSTMGSSVPLDPLFKVPPIDSLMNFDIDSLMNMPNTNFEYAPTMPYSIDLTESDIQEYTINKGIPLVLSNSMSNWSKDVFSLDFLQANYSDQKMINSPRNNETHSDLEGWTVGQYINYLQISPEERNPKYLYAKDVLCPKEWADQQKKLSKKRPCIDPARVGSPSHECWWCDGQDGVEHHQHCVTTRGVQVCSATGTQVW
ncbi:hypothetical protein DFA_11574 [Cavenderia fasciculata]|uniref:Uncharacterized protein n=1 Tax=Cavenderia fasciculata TaxID=261658 RepID=F4QDL6_CACFS|nr:uncharacterized protein DFA_11574 [Cavenderia fasciculata]EGG13813.1 hypothetical protein DFA_11574 [Cavenderia fasciculata]|eukprot:XP_004350521.1 hypothetical protein DFA_11574 [Cavenderia fasciculata]